MIRRRKQEPLRDEHGQLTTGRLAAGLRLCRQLAANVGAGDKLLEVAILWTTDIHSDLQWTRIFRC